MIFGVNGDDINHFWFYFRRSENVRYLTLEVELQWFQNWPRANQKNCKEWNEDYTFWSFHFQCYDRCVGETSFK